MNTSLLFRIVGRSTKLFNKTPLLRPIHNINTSRMSTSVSLNPTKEMETFLDVLPTITNSLARNPKFAEVPSVADWLKRVLEYNLNGGKKARGLSTVYAYEIVENPENVTEESLTRARIMGWCVEMLQAYLVVLDDMMDGSTTRRGVPCWYRLPDVGLGAINDSILIYMAIFQTLKMHFGHQSSYLDILELFNETLLNTSIGQHMDYTMAHRNKNNYNLFTLEQYNAIIKYKTSYYTCKLPICLGLYLADKTDKQLHEMAEDIFIEVGQFFQIQDDFMDCYVDESITGKAGTDIQEGKCTWLAVMALQRCNAEQRAEFELCYGSKDPADVQRIKRLYDDLELPKVYRDYERTTYERIIAKANNMPPTSSGEILMPALVFKQLDMYYNRKR